MRKGKKPLSMRLNCGTAWKKYLHMYGTVYKSQQSDKNGNMM